MSTPGYPGHGQNPPYGTPAVPGAPGAGRPPVPQGLPPTPQGTPYGTPPPLPTQRDQQPAPQQAPYAPHAPRGPEPGVRQAAPYAQPPVDPFALAAAAPLGTPEDPHTPLPRPGRTSAAPSSVGAAPGVPAAPSAGPSATPAPASASPFSAPSSPSSPSGEPIDFVPGITEDSAPRRAAAQRPAVPPQPPAPLAPPAAAEPARAEPATPPVPPAAPGAIPPEAVPAAAEAPAVLRLAVLVWDDGERHDVDGRLLIGRNPAEEEGVAAIAIRDETLSLSKTHFELEASDDGVWLIDRHSTNGVVLVRGSERRQAGPGERTRLAAGDVLEMGDRRATIEERS